MFPTNKSVPINIPKGVPNSVPISIPVSNAKYVANQPFIHTPPSPFIYSPNKLFLLHLNRRMDNKVNCTIDKR